MSDTTNLDLAVIGNCQIAALIDAQGAIVRACLPRLDGDPVFSGLLSPQGAGEDSARGIFAIIMRGTDPVLRRRQLRRGDLVYRYRTADDFGVPTTTFTVCEFWYVNALAAIGERDEARELLGRRNSVGLLSEDIDPQTGELWGNFPQPYSMVGIINSAMRLSRYWEDIV